MASNTFRLKINNAAACQFTIPDTVGNYKLKFGLSNNTQITVKQYGNTSQDGIITVGGAANTYRLRLGLSNGQSLVAGTFATPVVQTGSWQTKWSGTKTFTNSNTTLASASYGSFNAGNRIRVTGWLKDSSHTFSAEIAAGTNPITFYSFTELSGGKIPTQKSFRAKGCKNVANNTLVFVTQVWNVNSDMEDGTCNGAITRIEEYC